jgi:hypothetical protein
MLRKRHAGAGDRIENRIGVILLSTKIRAKGMKETVATLRKLDNETQKKLRKELRSKIKPVAQAIANDVPATPPLSGMNHNGVTRWTGVPKVGVQFRTGGGKTRQILSMRFTGGTRGQGGIGFDYAELAGSSRRPGSVFSRVYDRAGSPGIQHAVTGQGKAFNEGIRAAKEIRGRGGYFAFDSSIKKYPIIEGLGKRAVKDYMRGASAAIRKARFGF